MSNEDMELTVRRRAELCQEIMKLKGKNAGIKFLDRLINLPEDQLLILRDALKRKQEEE